MGKSWSGLLFQFLLVQRTWSRVKNSSESCLRTEFSKAGIATLCIKNNDIPKPDFDKLRKQNIGSPGQTFKLWFHSSKKPQNQNLVLEAEKQLIPNRKLKTKYMKGLKSLN